MCSSLLDRRSMSTIFRSELMTLCQLYLQPDAAYATVAELGELAIVQFRDVRLALIPLPLIIAVVLRLVESQCQRLSTQIRQRSSTIRRDRTQTPSVKREETNDATCVSPRFSRIGNQKGRNRHRGKQRQSRSAETERNDRSRSKAHEETRPRRSPRSSRR